MYKLPHRAFLLLPLLLSQPIPLLNAAGGPPPPLAATAADNGASTATTAAAAAGEDDGFWSGSSQEDEEWGDVRAALMGIGINASLDEEDQEEEDVWALEAGRVKTRRRVQQRVQPGEPVTDWEGSGAVSLSDPAFSGICVCFVAQHAVLCANLLLPVAVAGCSTGPACCAASRSSTAAPRSS
jgi:hypothetical protein